MDGPKLEAPGESAQLGMPVFPDGLPDSAVAAAAMRKPKRTVQKLTNGDRKWICRRRLTHHDERFTEMQDAFRRDRNPAIELKSGTVSGILKQSDKWLSIADGQETGTRTRSSKEPELEAALYAWRCERIQAHAKVRDEDLRDKARELAAFMGINTDKFHKGLSFSSGWLDRFKKRNGIKQTRYNRHGKKVDADDAQPSAEMDNSHLQAVIAAEAMRSYAQAQNDASFMPHVPALPQSAPVAQPAVPLPQDSFALAQCASIPQPTATSSIPRAEDAMHPNTMYSSYAELHQAAQAAMRGVIHATSTAIGVPQPDDAVKASPAGVQTGPQQVPPAPSESMLPNSIPPPSAGHQTQYMAPNHPYIAPPIVSSVQQHPPAIPFETDSPVDMPLHAMPIPPPVDSPSADGHPGTIPAPGMHDVSPQSAQDPKMSSEMHVPQPVT